MKRILFFLIISVGCSFMAKATDWLVEENGVAPAFPSISAAIAAASNGDRIFVMPRAGNNSYIDNPNVNKTLDILSYYQDSNFVVTGNWTVTPSAGMVVDIIGLTCPSGSISASGASPSGTRCTVRLLGCNFGSGSINFNDNLFDLTVYGSQLSDGQILYRHGQIVGNNITADDGYGIEAISETTATTDTSYIIGNQVTVNDASGGGYYGIYWNCNSMFFNILNNYVSTADNGIAIVSNLGSNATMCKIYNNSVNINGTGTFYSSTVGFSISMSGGGYVDCQNNIAAKTGTAYYYASTDFTSNTNSGAGTITLFYNAAGISSPAPTYFAGTSTASNNNSTGQTIGFGTGGVLTGYGANAGSPLASFDNLDLSQNTLGAYGGSFTLNNFFPLYTGATRTWLTNYNFNTVRVGTTVNVNANSYAR